MRIKTKNKLLVPATIAFFFYLVLTATLEILSYKFKGIYSFITVRLWLATGAFLLLAFIVLLVKKLFIDIKNKAFFEILGLLIPLLFLIFFIGNLSYSDINPDATQQLGAGLNAFKQPDFNYTGTAFLGYASRQFLIGALPALIFGRSILTLHIGFAYPFLIGYILLYFSVRDWLKRENLPEKWALLPMYALLAFRFIAEYYMDFEQAITPVALTMIGLALFIKLCIEADGITLIAFAWIINLMCNSYTPVVASLGLLAAAFGVEIIMILYNNKKETDCLIRTLDKEKWCKMATLGSLILYSLAVFYSTTLVQRQNRLNSFKKDVNIFKLAFESWRDFFLDANVHFLGIFMLVVIIYIVMSFALRLTIWDFMVSCWVLGVVLFSNLLQGYTSYQPCWIMQRNMIVIPVLCVAIFFALAKGIKARSAKIKLGLQISCMVGFFALAVYNFSQPHQSFITFNYIPSLKYMYSYMEESMKEMNLTPEDKFTLVLYTNNNFEINVKCYSAFFCPNATTIYKKYDDTSLVESSEGPIFYFSANEEVKAFENELPDSKSFHNSRMGANYTWYRLIKK